MPNSNCIIINDVINIEIPTIHISKKKFNVLLLNVISVIIACVQHIISE